MSEHTKGPWSACHNGECVCKYVLAQDHPVAKVIAGDWGDEPDFPYGHVPEEEAQANARLMAAAPELLDACEAAFNWIRYEQYQGAGEDPYLEQLKAAIEKAKGAP